MFNLEKICKETCLIAVRVGSFIRNEAINFQISSVEQKSLNNLVSYVDRKAEQDLVAALFEAFPEAGFITEENTNNTRHTEWNWVIDPLDGTTNFVHGLPAYAISVALMRYDRVVAGVVYEINRDECFYAYEGGGAFLNGKPIKVSSALGLKNALIATGFPYAKFEKVDNYLSILKELMQVTHGVRRIGSAAVDLAYVASGRFEGFFEYNLSSWDVAAGSLLVQEAGGKVSDFRGNSDFIFGKEIVAATPGCFEDLRSEVQLKFYL